MKRAKKNKLWIIINLILVVLSVGITIALWNVEDIKGRFNDISAQNSDGAIMLVGIFAFLYVFISLFALVVPLLVNVLRLTANLTCINLNSKNRTTAFTQTILTVILFKCFTAVTFAFNFFLYEKLTAKILLIIAVVLLIGEMVGDFIFRQRIIDERKERTSQNNAQVIKHYDLLIDQNNDPVYDSKELKEYMDKWDGDSFISKLQLNEKNRVLEIGVGTGRLAVRVAPKCKEFYGIDLSPKTVQRAKENLKEFKNAQIVCGDFLDYKFKKKFDVIYSSLTFMHIIDKEEVMEKALYLLKWGGRFVLSIDKNDSEYIDTGENKIKVYPDKKEDIEKYFRNIGIRKLSILEKENAFIFVAVDR